MQMLSVVDPRFILMVLLGSVAGLFVGAIPGLSVSMATALLVSITYTWEHSDALAMIMGVYVVGVFSGAVSAILINIPGAPRNDTGRLSDVEKRSVLQGALYRNDLLVYRKLIWSSGSGTLSGTGIESCD